MVCPKCHSEHEGGLATCSTCGASSGSASQADLATRVNVPSSPAPSTPISESDLATAPGGNVRPVPPDAASDPNRSDIIGWTTAENATDLSGALCLMKGAVLGGRYRIEAVLGEGGMGSVYKAHDLEVDRSVAIKIIRSELANDPVIVQRFKQELVLAREVSHRNVVRIFDLGVAGGLRFISMEYIEGRELSGLLAERGCFSPEEAANTILQVCRGLEAAHARGVIHRDLKPQNIMIDGTGRVAVMDFGIARSAEMNVAEPEAAGESTKRFESALTQLGSLIGTPRYMSPEQAKGEVVDARSDIYTVGIIFYELLTGHVPFKEQKLRDLSRRGSDPIVPPQQLNSKIPKRLNDITLRCLESRPDQRYANVQDLVVDLEEALGIRSRKSRTQTLLSYALVLSALLFAATLLWNRRTPTSAKPHAQVSLLVGDFTNRSGERVLDGVVEPLFQVALEGAQFVNTFNRGQAHKIAQTIQPGPDPLNEHVAQLVAVREGINVILSGSLERHGSGYELSAKALDTGGKVLANEQTSFGSPNDLPRAVDKLAEKIRRVLGDTTPNVRTAEAETFTSGSLPAAQQYAQAQQLQWEGKWAEAIASYKEAVRLDANMSRAYAGIAAILANQGKRQDAEHYYQLALAHLNRESDREKFRTRGGYYLLTRNYQKAVEQFSDLVKSYPFDSAGLANLALAYFYGRNMSAALEQGRKAVAIYPHNILQRNNVGLYALYAGDFEAAIKESESLIKDNPRFEKAYLCLGMAQLQLGDVAAAQESYKKLEALSDWGASEGALGEGDLLLYGGHFKEAVALLQKSTAKERAAGEGPSPVQLVALAEAQWHAGQRTAASQSAAEAVKKGSNDEGVLYAAGELYRKLGRRGEVLSLASRLGSRFEPEPRALGKLLEGELQMDSGKLHEAVASFGDAQKLADTWLGRFDLGRAYLAAKQYPDAENEMDVCLKRRGEASAVFLDDEPTVRYVPPAYYYLGVARAALQSPAAQDNLRSFLAMKQTSEQDPEVSDAQRRLGH